VHFEQLLTLISECLIIPFTGDNPATIVSFPLSPMDCIISLGTSTTLLLTTSNYKTSPAYHVLNHPTTKGLYFAMLSYKNGSLAREHVRDQLGKTKDWETFNSGLENTGVLCGQETKIGFYFPLPEIIPEAPSGTWRFEVDVSGNPEKVENAGWSPADDARAIVESQALSMRLRARVLLSDGKPRHLYFVGGASQNASIVSVMSQVVGSKEGVFRLMEGVTAGACARGSAIIAAWAYCGKGQNFEEFVRERWRMEGRLDRLAEGWSQDVWERYGSILDTYGRCEDIILSGTK
jgi:xylulokinase